MLYNGKNYLLLERRGMEYTAADAGRDNIGNYRVGSYDYSIRGKDGRLYILEFSSRTAWRVCKENKRTGAPLKKPIMETVMYNAMAINTEYQEDKTGSGFLLSWRNGSVEREFYNAAPVPYCMESILAFVNAFSVDQYDAILWVYSIETTRPAVCNWTPAGLIAEYARAHKIPVDWSATGEPRLRLYTGFYKYLCYNITPADGSSENITVYLERVAG